MARPLAVGGSALTVADAVVLLPPSEGKAGGGDGPPWRSTPLAGGVLGPPRAELVDALTATLRDSDVDPASVLRYGSAAVLDRAVETDLRLDTSPTLPAVERYTGVVLDGVDRPGLSPAARRRLDTSTWFLSGLWGPVAATDPLPDYRLKAGARVPGLGVVATWWRPRASVVLDDLVAGRLVWDLLTQEHGRMWRRGGSAAAVATVRFTTVDRGPRGVSNFHGKYLKGRFVRHLMTARSADVRAASGFTCDGWRIDEAASVLSGPAPELVFIR